jgi:nitrile hydratase subunit beta
MHGFGAAVWPGSDLAYHEQWERLVFAVATVTMAERLGSGSGRALREEMAPEDYLRASYYERWQWSNEQRLLRKATIAAGEIEAWIERLRAGESPPRRNDPDQARRVLEWLDRTEGLKPVEQARFAVRDRVRVRRMRPAGHTRCPRYVRGAAGVVERVRGADTFPDIGPYQGPVEPVYSVVFGSEELFGPSDEPPWTVALDLCESYLEAA